MIHVGHPRTLPGGVPVTTGGIDLLAPLAQEGVRHVYHPVGFCLSHPYSVTYFLFFLKIFLGYGLFLKSLLNLLQYCFCFRFWFFFFFLARNHVGS